MFLKSGKLKNILKILLVFSFIFFPLASFAVDTGLNEAANAAGLSTNAAARDIPGRIGDIISTILGLVGIIFLILMIYGGLMWMTASGSEEQVGKAKKIITSAVIGMIIVFSAYAITYFVTQTLLGS